MADDDRKRAREHELVFLAVDALHMLAIVDPGRAQHWTDEGLDLAAASADPRTRRWEVALHNNLGWTFHGEGRYEDALVEFEAAHIASKGFGTRRQESIARWTVARCLRSLGRYDEALVIQEQLALDNPSGLFIGPEIEALRAAIAAR